jgi:hypothetical protein
MQTMPADKPLAEVVEEGLRLIDMECPADEWATREAARAALRAVVERIECPVLDGFRCAPDDPRTECEVCRDRAAALGGAEVSLQGWECPKCGRVYSPFTPACGWCGPTTIGTPNANPSICSRCGAQFYGTHICMTSERT